MNNILVVGGLAVGGYLLYKYMQNESSVLATAIASTTNSNPVTSNPYAQFYVTPDIQNKLQNYYRLTTNSASWSTDFDYWGWAFGQLTGLHFPWTHNSFGLDPNVKYTVVQWADIVNRAVASGGINAALDGLGMLAIPGGTQIAYQNRILPYNLEVFNALIR
jgi:hypothetical protein